MKNYYDVFDVSPTASSKTINIKHRELVKKYHPDVNNSRDAHEKMTKLNEAYEILSDSTKRKEYDNSLKSGHNPNPQSCAEARKATHPQWQKETPSQNTDSRADKAEFLRQKAEERLKKEEKKRQMMMEHAKKRAEKKAEAASSNNKKEEIDPEKQKVIDTLAMLHRKSDARIRRNLETDEERHHAIKVLLSLVREDDSNMRRMAEEAERKQRIEEILALVKADKAEKLIR
ncbi:MAG: DnaJ domain-containing protein [Oscillospiraceae bacterium]|nr:DnaJ domain-containing protein [Oscillospiraceae bacterium]